MNTPFAVFGKLSGRKSRLQRRKTAVASRWRSLRGLRLEPLEQRQLLSLSIPVPDGDFSADAAANCINSNAGGGLTFTAPMTATLSGWAITALPSTANGGLYSAWEPCGAVDNITSSGAAPFGNNAPWVGNQPASAYNALMYYPGELYDYGSVVGGAQPAQA